VAHGGSGHCVCYADADLTAGGVFRSIKTRASHVAVCLGEFSDAKCARVREPYKIKLRGVLSVHPRAQARVM
jgi:hypothetical protein